MISFGRKNMVEIKEHRSKLIEKTGKQPSSLFLIEQCAHGIARNRCKTCPRRLPR